MKTIQLRNGEQIPQIGLGVYQTAIGEQTENAVRWAIEAGYRHIDTATVYGNEESVGNAIADCGVDRKDIFLTTKLWNEDIRKGHAKEAFEKSLKALKTDYVDLYLIHWAADGYEKAWKDIVELYNEGRIRTIGVSNFQKYHLERIADISNVLPAVNQIESHPYFQNQDMIDYCQQNGIVVEVWSPLGGTGGNLLADPAINEIAVRYGKTAAQIVLRWDIQRGVVVLPKSTHKDRIISNMEIFDFELAQADIDIIRSLERGQRVGPNPDNVDF